MGEDREARPWETVGGVGFGGGGAPAPAKPAYVKPKGRADLTPGSAAAVEAAEACNDEAVKAFKAKYWQICYDHASECDPAARQHVAYLGNRAAAAIKMLAAQGRFSRRRRTPCCATSSTRRTWSYVRAALLRQEGSASARRSSCRSGGGGGEMAPDNKAWPGAALRSARRCSPRRRSSLPLEVRRLRLTADFD